MLFNSYTFVLAFLPLALTGFFAAARLGRRAAGCWLIAASLAFYGWWNVSFVPLLVASMAGNYAAALLLSRLVHRPRRQTWVLVIAIAANLAALVVLDSNASRNSTNFVATSIFGLPKIFLTHVLRA